MHLSWLRRRKANFKELLALQGDDDSNSNGQVQNKFFLHKLIQGFGYIPTTDTAIPTTTKNRHEDGLTYRRSTRQQAGSRNKRARRNQERNRAGNFEREGFFGCDIGNFRRSFSWRRCLQGNPFLKKKTINICNLIALPVIRTVGRGGTISIRIDILQKQRLVR